MGTDILFAQPSFLRGAARVVDLWGQLTRYNTSRTTAEADALALYSDFSAVGGDLRLSMERERAADGQLSLPLEP